MNVIDQHTAHLDDPRNHRRMQLKGAKMEMGPSLNVLFLIQDLLFLIQLGFRKVIFDPENDDHST